MQFKRIIQMANKVNLKHNHSNFYNLILEIINCYGIKMTNKVNYNC